MYECIIIGTGPGGFSAALNLKIYGKNFLWFGSRNLSDKVLKAEKIRNYPGIPEVGGRELYGRFWEHIEKAGLEITEKTATSVMHTGSHFLVLADNEIYESKTLILAMGVMADKALEGEEAFLGKGISYCATCDGMLYKDKKIAVLCNSPRYETEVEYLAGLAEEVLYYPTFASGISMDNVRTFKEPPTAVKGEKRVSTILFRDGSGEEVDGVFCLRNAIAPTALVPGLAVEGGHILVDRRMAASLPGCFAAGDCTGRPYQYAKAVGEGNIAAHSVVAYLSNF